ncbi:MAG: hypothetical protein QHC90_16095 [Shinella sp.]|nr:hypothetical protein [Shinella sp.]
MLSENGRRRSWKMADSNEELEERYKPLGLRAVLAAATQRKPEKAESERREIPPVLQPLYD